MTLIRRVCGTISKGKMPAEMAMDFIRQLKDSIVVAVLYTNGEPLLYKDLPKVIQYATDQHVATIITEQRAFTFTEEMPGPF